MRKIYTSLAILSFLLFAGCSKDFLKPYDDRIVGRWQIDDINKFGFGGSVNDLPFRDGSLQFNKDGTLIYTTSSGSVFNGTWDIQKKRVGDGDNSNVYHSLQITAQRRFSRSSQINMAYTWAKNMTNSQNEFATAPQNTYDLKAEYARANLDRRHVFNINYVYEIPYFSDQKGFQGKLLGGWQFSGIFYYYTGLAFAPATSSNDPAGLGLLGNSPSGSRPDMLCDPNATATHDLTPAVWFNTACFANPPAGDNDVGNAGRNTINGPSTTRLDATLAKNIRFSESKSIQLRWEVFNVLNHTNFTTFSSTNVTSSVFGQINLAAARDARSMQLAIKFSF